MTALSLAVREAGDAFGRGAAFAKARHGGIVLNARKVGADLWVSFERKGEQGGLAWRVALLSDDVELTRADGDALIAFEVTSALGRHRITVEADDSEEAMFVLTASFRPRD